MFEHLDIRFVLHICVYRSASLEKKDEKIKQLKDMNDKIE